MIKEEAKTDPKYQRAVDQFFKAKQHSSIIGRNKQRFNLARKDNQEISNLPIYMRQDGGMTFISPKKERQWDYEKQKRQREVEHQRDKLNSNFSELFDNIQKHRDAFENTDDFTRQSLMRALSNSNQEIINIKHNFKDRNFHIRRLVGERSYSKSPRTRRVRGVVSEIRPANSQLARGHHNFSGISKANLTEASSRRMSKATPSKLTIKINSTDDNLKID